MKSSMTVGTSSSSWIRAVASFAGIGQPTVASAAGIHGAHVDRGLGNPVKEKLVERTMQG